MHFFLYVVLGVFVLGNQAGADAAKSIDLKKTTVAVGSTNPIKIQAVQNAFGDAEVRGYSSLSHVGDQPLSDEETRQGAINRAQAVLKTSHADFGVGLEAGVFFIQEQPYLCHWGALVDKEGNIYLTNGPSIRLPQEFRADLLTGLALEDIMHRSTGIQKLGTKEGAIGIFTDGKLNRARVLTDIVKVLLAQYQYFYSE